MNKFKLIVLCTALSLFPLVHCFAKWDTKHIIYNQNPILISDTLKTKSLKQLIRPSLDPLSANIYWNSLQTPSYIAQQFHFYHKTGTPFLELRAFNELYKGKLNTGIHILEAVFRYSKDSLQQMQTSMNLAKLYYQNGAFDESEDWLAVVQEKFWAHLSSRKRLDLLLLKSDLFLAEGNYLRAERTLISQALPLGSKLGARQAYKCYLLLGKVYYKWRQYTPAKWFFLQANSIALNINFISGRIETSLLLAKAKIKGKDYTIALQDLSRASNLMRSGNFETYRRDLQEMRAESL